MEERTEGSPSFHPLVGSSSPTPERSCASLQSTRMDLSGLTTYSIHERESKVRVEDFAPTPTPLRGFLERTPRILAGNELRAVVEAVANARRRDRPVAL